jgi:hypothetical protein
MLQANEMRQSRASIAGCGKLDLTQIPAGKKRLTFAKTKQAEHLDQRDNPDGLRTASAGHAGTGWRCGLTNSGSDEHRVRY